MPPPALVLPTIDGSHDYLAEVQPDPEDAVSPGVFVPEWDDGRVAVGNGDAEAHWVHDDVGGPGAGAASGRATPERWFALLATDLYMIFRADADAIRAEVERERLGAAAAEQVERCLRRHPQPPRSRHRLRRQPLLVRAR